jgi:hypothetical protein
VNICPITLEPVEGGGLYSRAGLRTVHPRLENLLPLRGKKRKLTLNDWVDYLCRERLGLLPAILDPILQTLEAARDAWVRKIENSYLSTSAKAGYLAILSERRSRLFD